MLVHHNYLEIAQIDDQTVLDFRHTSFNYIIGLFPIDIRFPEIVEYARTDGSAQAMAGVVKRLRRALHIDEVQFGSIVWFTAGQEHGHLAGGVCAQATDQMVACKVRQRVEAHGDTIF